MRHRSFSIAVLALVACGDSAGPLSIGQPFALQSINGQPLPWESPLQAGSFITEGWITIIDATTAERHERGVKFRPGDTLENIGDWTYRARWKQRFGLLTLTYHEPRPGRLGPLNTIDTFFVSAERLVHRETGYVAPLDTMVRIYCRTRAPC